MDISSIALQGIAQAESQADTAASALANAGTTAQNGANLDVVDISAQMLSLLSAQNEAAINIDILKTADQIHQSLIDVMA